MGTRLLLCAVSSLFVLLAGCTNPDDAADDPPPGTVLAKGGGDNNIFAPVDVEVAQGGHVTWRGHSGDHTVTFESPIDGSGTLHDSGNLAVGEEYELTFPQPGTFRYRCIYHSFGFGADQGMVGVVRVT